MKASKQLFGEEVEEDWREEKMSAVRRELRCKAGAERRDCSWLCAWLRRGHGQ